VRRVLITGAGGSIGSALARRLRNLDLTLYESSEYGLYEISEELPAALAVLGDVKDTDRLSRFARGCDTIFHCAAYKHVHLLEGVNASQARKNNIEGTRSALGATREAEKFVLLSTDKACNPANELGYSKREAERLTLAAGRTAARLGNVFGSRGSVVPKWERQIRNGGPVSVTHPDATRYFVSMEETVSFLIACAARPAGIYQMPMGEPVKILDLARELIGDKKIEIEFTGLRAGEKLHEEIEELAVA